MNVLKKSAVKRGISVLFAVLLLTACLLSFSSCSDYSAKNGELETLGKKFIDSVISGDDEGAYSCIYDEISVENKVKVVNDIKASLGDMKSYEMKLVGWSSNTSNRVSTHYNVYEIKGDNGREYQLDIGVSTGYDKLTSLYLSDVTSALPRGVVKAIDIALSILSIACIVFGVLMIVDCAKRKVSLKALWIIIIFLCVSVGFSFGASQFGLGGFMGLLISMSGASQSAGVTSVKLVIPVGAIIYFCLRKRLSAAAEKRAARWRAAEEQVLARNQEKQEQDEDKNS